MQKSADAVLVSIHEFSNDSCGRALQHVAGAVPVASAGDGAARSSFVSRLVLVQPASGHVRLGAAGARTLGVGLLRLERGPAKAQRLVHAQTAHVLAYGGGWGAPPPAGSRGAGPPPPPFYCLPGIPPAHSPC